MADTLNSIDDPKFRVMSRQKLKEHEEVNLRLWPFLQKKQKVMLNFVELNQQMIAH